jgi:RNA polymerase sigma-32 factor
MKKEGKKKKLPKKAPNKAAPKSASRNKKRSTTPPKAAVAKKGDRKELPSPTVRTTTKANPAQKSLASKLLIQTVVKEAPLKSKPIETVREAKKVHAAVRVKAESAMGATGAASAPEPPPAEKDMKAIPAPAAGNAGKAIKALKAAKKTTGDDSEKSLVKFDPLQRYLSEISRYRLLTRDQERELGIRVKEEGDTDAAYALVTANLRLVVKIALEFQRVWMQNLLDLIQEGNIGLMQAVKKFDPYKNVKFSYYASFWIKAYILKFIMDNWRLVKIGTTQGQRKLFFKLKKEKQRLVEQGFDPKPKLLSERLGVSEREIVDMDQRLDGWDVSLDAPLKNDSETERIEFLSTESESVEDQVSKKEIELLLHNKITEFRKKMSPREIEIFELRIFSDNPVTLQEIGDRYGISRERVRQIEKNIIRKMREFFKHEIPDFASYSEDNGTE